MSLVGSSCLGRSRALAARQHAPTELKREGAHVAHHPPVALHPIHRLAIIYMWRAFPQEILDQVTSVRRLCTMWEHSEILQVLNSLTHQSNNADPDMGLLIGMHVIDTMPLRRCCRRSFDPFAKPFAFLLSVLKSLDNINQCASRKTTSRL